MRVELGKTCYYAIHALALLTERTHPDEPVLLSSIAATLGASEAFLAEVFQSLRASGMVHKPRGRPARYGLSRRASQISLYDVLVATEGTASLHAGECMAEQARGPFAGVWRQVEDLVAGKLRSTTIQDLVSQSADEADRRG
jgi:Rrf2 family protein